MTEVDIMVVKVDTNWFPHDTDVMLYHHDTIRPNRSARQLARREIIHHVVGALAFLLAISPWCILLLTP